MISHHNTNLIYFAGNKLFRSYNRGDDWDVISPDLTTADPEKIAGNVPHCTITTIAESALDRHLLMVGTDDGKVHLTRNGGKNWQDLSDRFPFRPENWWCSRVELSHHDKDVAFVCFTGYREDDFRPFVFMTNDGGKSFTSISSGLPHESVNVIKQDRLNKNLLFVGTEMSAYASLDGGKNWFEFNGGMPRASVQDLLIHPRDGDLILGTHGRGMFIIDDISALQQMSAAKEGDGKTDPIRLFQPRTALTYSNRLGSGSISGNRKWTASSGNNSVNIWYQVKDELEEAAVIRILNVEGKQVNRFRSETKPGLHRKSIRLGSAAFRGRGRGRGAAQTPRLVPGRYTVELTLGESKQTAPLVIERH